MPILAPASAELEPNIARTDGPGTATPATVSATQPAIIGHPVMKPRCGLIAWPTQSKEAPQFELRRFSRRQELAMISIGSAIRIRTGPDP